MTAKAAISGQTAQEIARSVESAINGGFLKPGDLLPPVRELSADLSVSPGTVAAAYKDLRSRGITIAKGRTGTRVAARPPLLTPSRRPVPEGAVDLASGSPDLELLPDLARAVNRLRVRQTKYGNQTIDPELAEVARAALREDGIPSDDLTVANGAMDGIERVLKAHLRAGDAVAVEDPAFPPLLDLLRSHGLKPRGVAVEDDGLEPEALASVLRQGVAALVFSPRAQNPTGAALSDDRAVGIHAVLAKYPDVLVVEDDHAGPISGVPAQTVAWQSPRSWAVVRSVSKWLGPDLRLAVVTGDRSTIARVEGQRRLGPGWVSMLTQQLTADLWSNPAARRKVAEAAKVYTRRREHLLTSLADQGFAARGRSGLNVWVPVPNEHDAVLSLLDHGYAVDPGERYRLASEAGLRVTIAALLPDQSEEIVAILARCREGSFGVSR